MTAPSETPSTFPPAGRLLGIDYGTKRVGVAIATPDRTIASPLEIYQRRNEQLDARYFKTVIEDYRPCGIVVGLPVHVSGAEGESAQGARRYGKWLGELSGLPVEFWDERYTSSVAEDYLLGADMTRQQRKKRIDMVAAQIMLQSYLNFHRPPASLTELAADVDADDETSEEE
ncbi:Holliday junction resolvase RuvX [Planctomicrobium piriforme]|uniref:Putative pre-16S rRNA nuclease n=1 Tax=Planctomicrobium piriforme TaxID=1576369 RepID=A0A1I3FUK8_9PLAN|nr:Holliday junction resolvase RuvX [Planctomicrobium piriforme]SFI14933.1 putative holliday junction resolvase [Planctomicrobium piriforme]